MAHSHAGVDATTAASGAEHQKRLMMSLGLTSTVFIAEVVSAIVTGSLALLVDAGHMLTDMSVSMWPASTSSASDPVTMALTTSAMNTVEVSPNDIMSLFWCSAPLAAVVASTPAWLCAMMGFLSSSLVRSAAIETASQYHFHSSQNAGNPSPKAGVSKFC